jgi:opacity protein-like surface antigen
MKKIALASLLALAAVTASAVEVGVNGSYDGTKHDHAGYGLTVGEHFGSVSATVGYDRYNNNNLSKYSVVGGYDVAKIGTATVTAKVGTVYLDQEAGKTYSKDRNGWAGLVGAGISIPVTKSVSATADYRYQAGQSRVNDLNGSTVQVGAKYSF